METKNNKNSNNSNANAENTNNVYRLIEKTDEQLASTSKKWNERAESGQTITFTKAEQKKASSADAKNTDKNGFLPGIFWTGYIITADEERHDFSRLDANGICRTFESVCTWKRATRSSLLDGNSTRTAEQRAEDATSAIVIAKAKPTENSITAMLWTLAEKEGMLSKLHAKVVQTMTAADAEAVEKAQSKESKTAKAKRELKEAKAQAAAAKDTNRKMIAALLATGQYKDENEIREKLGI